MMWEIFLSAYNSIIANKIRSFLTIIGIVIGIASVITISGLGEGSKKSVNDNLAKLGTNRINISTNYRSTITAKDRLNYDDEELLKAYDQIVNISPLRSLSTKYEFSDDYYTVTLNGVNEEADKIENLDMMYGTFLTESSLKSKNRVIVIDNVLAKKVFNKEDVVGEQIKLTIRGKEKVFNIIGVYENTSESNTKQSQNYSATAYTPITVIDLLLPNFYVSQYEATVKDINKIDEISDNVIKLLSIKHRNNNKYNVESVMERMESINSILSTLTIFISFVAGISLFVGGIGVMNIMLVSVTERTKEIGICKSIGASNNHIMFQFIIEAIILCSVGGILGIVGGYAASYIIGGLVNVTPYIPLLTVFIAFGISTLIGVVFGVFPAKKAAELNPIDALRYE
ncbi:MAG: ABC transporter permease [Fusobacteriaceae bacterium]|jgi:putative ABC transport system permease protein|nr:ABC transporter permease [Fusobacteriaceae bacterium]MBP6466595.1 ABC transporter permease [Fusobacteriaceae bacterium]MBU9917110.1 ABC transporter permease [Fusobacteriaceae bacterium]